jgi:hypothetical protein
MTPREIIALLGGFSAIVAAITWLARSLVGQLLSRDIERFKSRLEHETERFTSELERQVKEHEIRFTTLHEKRRDAVAELYELLADAVSTHQTIGFLWTVDLSEMRNAVDEAFAGYTGFEKLLTRNRIYLDRGFADEVQSALDRLTQPLTSLAVQLSGDQPDKARVTELVKEIQNSCEDALALLNFVETGFREILGVDTESTSGGDKAD